MADDSQGEEELDASQGEEECLRSFRRLLHSLHMELISPFIIGRRCCHHLLELAETPEAIEAHQLLDSWPFKCFGAQVCPILRRLHCKDLAQALFAQTLNPKSLDCQMPNFAHSLS